MRKHRPILMEKARNLYVLENRTAKEISELLGVSRRTVQIWKDAACKLGDDWDIHRTAKIAAKMDQDTQLAASMEKFQIVSALTEKALLNDAEQGAIAPLDAVNAMAKLARAHRDMTASILSASKKISELAIAMRVLQEVRRVTQEKFPQHALPLSEVYEYVGRHLSQVFKP